MCIPEDDLPKNVLLSEFAEEEMDHILDKAVKLFDDDLEKLINDLKFKQIELNENILQLVSSINNRRFESFL